MAAWDGTGLPPWRVIPVALSAGALTPADVATNGVQVDPVGRSHAVYRVSIRGTPRFFLKLFGPSRGATDGMASRERAVLSLAQHRPAVAALVPEAWPWRTSTVESHEAVATAAVNGAEAWKLEHSAGGARTIDDAWLELVHALAAPLAAFHRATRDLARPGANIPAGLEPLEPWALRLMDGDAAPELWTLPTISTLLREASSDPVLVAGLREARGLWKSLSLVHADLKHDNVLLEPLPEGGSRVRVLDWEMARIGDPAWDLATLATRLTVARGDGPPWIDADIDAAAALLRAYSAASGLAVPPLAKRLVYYAGAALLMMTVQHASTLSPGGDPSDARQLLFRSRATFARAASLVAAIAQRAERS